MKNPDRYTLNFKSLGKSALIVEWPAIINESILIDILSLQTKIENIRLEGVVETVNAYNTLTIFFKPEIISSDDLTEKVRSIHNEKDTTSGVNGRRWHIPVCYDSNFGIDLEEMARSKQMSTSEIVSLHSGSTYTIYFIGFLPGFLYLGGLSEILHTPRRNTPRTRIEKGAVAIGGAQTGIYPSESPGGWNIIGNCPLALFDPQNNPPCFAQAGDQLMFYAIDRQTHTKITKEVAGGNFKVKFDVL